jgi:GH25 family lysozyme M1 (1,4-beta-N-acetylmuramidase)
MRRVHSDLRPVQSFARLGGKVVQMVRVGSARIDENGHARGGAAGDQTGREVMAQDWYDHGLLNPWVLLRPLDEVVAEKIAACKNNLIGYDQGQRDTLYAAVAALGFDVSKLTAKKVETDCSALVRVCMAYAGIILNLGDTKFTTANMAAILVATKKFERLTDRRYVHSSTYLKRGDILVTAHQGHTVVVLSNGSMAYPLGGRILQKGCFGPDVGKMQRLLAGLKYVFPKSGTDHDFGAETLAAVKAFQAAAELVVDGVMDAADLAKLVDISVNGWPAKPVTPPVETPSVDPGGEIVYPVRGIFPDVSDNQGAIQNFDKFCAGTDCAIFRAVRGNLLIDAQVARNMSKCKARNYPFGVYVFFKAFTEASARKFVQKMYAATAQYGPRFYVLDVEGWYPKVAVLAAFDEARKLGITCLGIYMGSFRWRARYKKMVAALVDFVWLANYGKNTGWLSNIPDNPCALHQYTSVGPVPGISDKTCDLNRLTGNVPLSFFTGRKHSGVEYPGIVQATAKVAVRQGAGATYKALAAIPKGRFAIKRDGSVDGWQAVTYNGMDGFVSTGYVKTVNEGAK